jgi:allantoate deiminase
MPINVNRIRSDIAAIAACTETPGEGATRPTFSPQWKKACEYVIAQANAIECQHHIDVFGNLHVRPKDSNWDTPAYLCGSHIDTVPHGGDYDGVIGIVVALELLRSADDDGIKSLPLELIIFAEEEGPTFGLGMIGSRAWVGELNEDQLRDLRNRDGENYFEAGKPFGVDVGKWNQQRLNKSKYLGLIEVHIEQGPGMWRRDEKLAIVRAIAGRRQYQITITGEANHAGATSMKDRRDALVGAASIVMELEHLAPQLSESAVITVGRLNNLPNAVNVIPQRVEFTIDFRAGDDAALETGDTQIRRIIGDVCKQRNLECKIELTETIAARQMDEKLRTRLGSDLPITVSGALHDSAVLAPHTPTAMLFVPSRDGISHNPAEFSRVEDIAAAARVVENLVRRPTLKMLNAMPRDPFVAVCGRFFEHSPWIAQQAWNDRPFASLDDLHKKMCAWVASAKLEKRVQLIEAHPDLVGRLAREGKLTRESNAEQSAAGLSELSENEIAAFERFNKSYREKFGFPFVICARQNRKEAILAAFPNRLENSREQEIAAALDEIYKIAQLRMVDAISED